MADIPTRLVYAAARARVEHEFTQFAYGYGRRGWECTCGAKRDHMNPAPLDTGIEQHLAEVTIAAVFAECEVREEVRASLRWLVITTPPWEDRHDCVALGIPIDDQEQL